jgi:hypothetical protein
MLEVGSARAWDHGAMRPWGPAPRGLWDHGAMRPWGLGTTGPVPRGLWDHGAMRPWGLGTTGAWAPRHSLPVLSLALQDVNFYHLATSGCLPALQSLTLTGRHESGCVNATNPPPPPAPGRDNSNRAPPLHTALTNVSPPAAADLASAGVAGLGDSGFRAASELTQLTQLRVEAVAAAAPHAAASGADDAGGSPVAPSTPGGSSGGDEKGQLLLTAAAGLAVAGSLRGLKHLEWRTTEHISPSDLQVGGCSCCSRAADAAGRFRRRFRRGLSGWPQGGAWAGPGRAPRGVGTRHTAGGVRRSRTSAAGGGTARFAPPCTLTPTVLTRPPLPQALLPHLTRLSGLRQLMIDAPGCRNQGSAPHRSQVPTRPPRTAAAAAAHAVAVAATATTHPSTLTSSEPHAPRPRCRGRCRCHYTPHALPALPLPLPLLSLTATVPTGRPRDCASRGGGC